MECSGGQRKRCSSRPGHGQTCREQHETQLFQTLVAASGDGVHTADKHKAESGAGEGNRTLVISLEGCCSTIELHPRCSAHRTFRGFLHRRIVTMSRPQDLAK